MSKLFKYIIIITICILSVGCYINNDNKEIQTKIKTTIIEKQPDLTTKTISFLGDSITTYEGYSNDCINTNSTICENRIYYKGYNYIQDVNDTWWKQTVNNTGLNLLVNNSFSGDRVVLKGQIRNQQLHDDTGEIIINPDIIVVYLGINDFIKNVPTDEFGLAYETMIVTMKSTYPNADIFLLNLLPNTTTLRPESELIEYNKYISFVADKFNATLVDINTQSEINIGTCNTHMADIKCLHPNKDGMTAMANVVTTSIINKYLIHEEIKEEIQETIKQPEYNYIPDLITIIILSLSIIIGIMLIKISKSITQKR